MNTSSIETPDWSKLPSPQDDGAAAHLAGMRLAAHSLPATNGSHVDFSALKGFTVVFVYPRMGKPGEPNPDGWDLIPGARGCTPQACAYRDLYEELRTRGVEHLFGLSSQDTARQQEAVERLHLPFPLVSDRQLLLSASMRFPIFQTSGETLYKRLTLVVREGVIEFVFYPVFPPDQDAKNVAAWLDRRAAQDGSFHR